MEIKYAKASKEAAGLMAGWEVMRWCATEKGKEKAIVVEWWAEDEDAEKKIVEKDLVES